MKKILFVLLLIGFLSFGLFADQSGTLDVYGFISDDSQIGLEVKSLLTAPIDLKSEPVQFADTGNGVRVGKWTLSFQDLTTSEEYTIQYNYGALESDDTSNELEYVLYEKVSDTSFVSKADEATSLISIDGTVNSSGSVIRELYIKLTSAASANVQTFAPAEDYESTITITLLGS
jgi:hypothetical protein